MEIFQTCECGSSDLTLKKIGISHDLAVVQGVKHLFLHFCSALRIYSQHLPTVWQTPMAMAFHRPNGGPRSTGPVGATFGGCAGGDARDHAAAGPRGVVGGLGKNILGLEICLGIILE